MSLWVLPTDAPEPTFVSRLPYDNLSGALLLKSQTARSACELTPSIIIGRGRRSRVEDDGLDRIRVY
jgi:hypothetical protein